jgi:hypothetical protein
MPEDNSSVHEFTVETVARSLVTVRPDLVLDEDSVSDETPLTRTVFVLKFSPTVCAVG